MRGLGLRSWWMRRREFCRGDFLVGCDLLREDEGGIV
jgi:hypothetical protein